MSYKIIKLMTKRTFKDYIKQYSVHIIFPILFSFLGGLFVYVILKDKDIEAARFFGRLGFYVGAISALIYIIRIITI